MASENSQHPQTENDLSVEPAKTFTAAPLNPVQKRLDALERLKTHFLTDVATAHTDTLLLACCLISGLVDSTVYNAYGTFVLMQTVSPAWLWIELYQDHSDKLIRVIRYS